MTKVKLIDGQEISLYLDRTKCCENLFKSSNNEINFRGMHEECYSSIQKTDAEMRKDLYSNIILSGGNTNFRGLPERLTKEIQKLTPSSAYNKVKVIALPERKFSTWMGASILCSLSNFQSMWITKDEFRENKEKIHERCL